MEKYIPLDAVVAEIDRRISILQKHPMENHKTICHLDSLKQSINSLEVKEVDLQSEIDDVFKKYKNGYNGLFICKKTDFSLTAQHFFELGIKASNPLTWEDIRKIDALCYKVDAECDLEEKEHYKEILNRFKKLR